MKTIPLSRLLLPQAANNRHGLSLEAQEAQISLSDVDDIVHMGVPNSIKTPWESASGGIGRTSLDAKLAAIGESVERYAATINALPIKTSQAISKSEYLDATEWCLFTDAQRRDPNFPFNNIYSKDCPLTTVYDLQDNRQYWMPHPLVALRDDFQTGVPTSSGLAAGSSAQLALLRAIQELIERDALMMTWLHSLPARAIRPPAAYLTKVKKLQGEMWAFDLTPAYSPFAVIAVAGGIPKQGQWRYSLGVACRETWQAAFEKAYLEWNQGVLFAGIYQKNADISTIVDPHKVKSFDEHAIYYTLHPEQWAGLPMFANRQIYHQPAIKGTKVNPRKALLTVKKAFAKQGIRLYYRDLTTVDAYQLGIRVIRAVSPDLAAIFAHQEWPLLGHLADKLASRYPWAPKNLIFPNLMPHPLG